MSLRLKKRCLFCFFTQLVPFIKEHSLRDACFNNAMINTVDCHVFVSPEWGCRAAPWLCLHNTAIKTFCKRSTFLKHWVMWLYKLPQRHELCVYKWKKHSKKKKKTQCQSCLNPLWTWHASGCICYLIGVYAKYYFHLSSCCFWGCFSNLLQMWKKWKHVFFFLFFCCWSW